MMCKFAVVLALSVVLFLCGHLSNLFLFFVSFLFFVFFSSFVFYSFFLRGFWLLFSFFFLFLLGGVGVGGGEGVVDVLGGSGRASFWCCRCY